MLLVCFSATLGAANTQKLKADYNKVKGQKSETYFKCIGAGRANEGLRADWQQQLRTIQEDFAFEYIRFHGLLHDDMGVCMHDNAKPDSIVYNFQYVDVLYDYLLSLNIKPFVELGFMPQAIASGDKTVFWWKGNITPPKQQEMWGELISRLVNHFTERYGAEEVETWYFEVWNEPNHPSFFSAKQEDYFQLYTTAVKAIKAINPKYKVGGPATAGAMWEKELIAHCEKTNTELDFISTHAYGVHGALDEFGTMQLRLIGHPDCVIGAVNNTRKEMTEVGHADTELHYTEWSSSYSPRDMTHDTYMNAPYILNTLRKTDKAAQGMSYWTFTDIFEESGVPAQAFHGGFGLQNLHGIKKPTYHAYKFLHSLGDTELKTNNPNSWVCKDEKGGVQVLAYNVTMPTYEEFDHNNKIFSKLRIPQDIEPLEIDIKNVPNGTYVVRTYTTGYLQNDPLSAFIQMGSPAQLTCAQEQTLHQVSTGAAQSIEVINITNGKYQRTIPMRENDVYFVTITPTN